MNKTREALAAIEAALTEDKTDTDRLVRVIERQTELMLDQQQTDRKDLLETFERMQARMMAFFGQQTDRWMALLDIEARKKDGSMRLSEARTSVAANEGRDRDEPRASDSSDGERIPVPREQIIHDINGLGAADLMKGPSFGG